MKIAFVFEGLGTIANNGSLREITTKQRKQPHLIPLTSESLSAFFLAITLMGGWLVLRKTTVCGDLSVNQSTFIGFDDPKTSWHGFDRYDFVMDEQTLDLQSNWPFGFGHVGACAESIKRSFQTQGCLWFSPVISFHDGIRSSLNANKDND